MIPEHDINPDKIDRILMRRTREILWEWCQYAEDENYIESPSAENTKYYGVPLKIGATDRYVQWYVCNRDKVSLL